MTEYELMDIYQEPKDYRGALVYRQEYGYKLITMMVNLLAPDEQSFVVSHTYDLDVVEEAEHIPSSSLTDVDVYHFAVTDGTEIELTIRDRKVMYTARYAVVSTGIEEHSSFLWLDIVASSESRCLSVQSTLDR